MTARREFTRKQRAEIILRATGPDGVISCEGCGLRLGRRAFEIDHVIPEALVVDKSAPLTAKDGQLLGVECCHRAPGGKTGTDVARIRKADRQRDGLSGAKRSARPMPGSRRSGWRKRMDGTVERRT